MLKRQGETGQCARSQACGFSIIQPLMSPHPAIPSVPVPLAPGSCLGAYELGACHGEDLDGFDYDAVERHSGRAVTIREGCPVGLVARVGAQVVPVPGSEDDFRDWLARWTRLTGHWEQAGHTAELARLSKAELPSGYAKN